MLKAIIKYILILLICIMILGIIYGIVNDNKIDNTLYKDENKKIIYLTFDDGPARYTERILDILEEHNIKATFFLTNQYPRYQYLIKEIYEDKHSIGIHSYTHKWNIYDSVDSYMYDLENMNNLIYQYTNHYTKLLRFPGGSSNTVSIRHKKNIMTELTKYVDTLGYTYFDWNVNSGDTYFRSKRRLFRNIKKQLKYNNNIILMHDSKYYTYKVLEDVIEYGLDNGYVFMKLNVNSPSAHQKLNN